jgi:hypothetical protein
MAMNYLTRRSFLSGVVTATRIGRGQNVNSARPALCRVVDSQSGKSVPARIRLVDAAGNELVPLGHSRDLADGAQEGDVRFQSRRYCYVDGEFQVEPRRFPIQYQVIKDTNTPSQAARYPRRT